MLFRSNVSPWSGRLRQGNGSPGSGESQVTTGKGKEKVGQPMAGFDIGNSSNDESLDEEFGIPKLSTPGVKRIQEGIRKST